MLILFIIVSIMTVAFLAMVGLTFSARRRLPVFPPSAQSKSLGGVAESLVSSTAYGLIRAARQIAKTLSIRFLVALHSVASLGRAILTRLEKRFALLIDAVRGHGHPPNGRHRGSVSFFLEQIKDYKDEMTRRANTRS